jgi:hypothetical protein
MATYADDFNRADAGSLGTASGSWPWTEWSSNFTIVSNKARQESEFTCGAFTPELDSSDQYVEVTVTSVTTGQSSFVGPIVRAPATIGTGPTDTGAYYGLIVSAVAMNTFAIREKVVNSTTHNTLASVTQAITSGDVLRLEAQGSSLRGYLNGNLMVSYDSAILSDQKRAGLYNDAATGMTFDWDNFSAGDLSAPPQDGLKVPVRPIQVP